MFRRGQYCCLTVQGIIAYEETQPGYKKYLGVVHPWAQLPQPTGNDCDHKMHYSLLRLHMAVIRSSSTPYVRD